MYVDSVEQLNQVVNELHDNGCQITQYIADNPKRANAKGVLCHSSWFPCEYCFAKGTKLVTNSVENKKKKDSLLAQKELIAEKIESIKKSASKNPREVMRLKILEKKLTLEEKKIKAKKTNIVWPKTSRDGPPRNIEDITDIIEKIENNVHMTIDESKGITRRSIFIDLPNFNFVRDIPCEYLHCTCLGVTKKRVELTFNVGSTRQRVTKRKLSPPSLFNVQIHKVKGTREFNRRIRELDFAVYKGQEYRNLLLFYFPLVLNCIEENGKERHMWLYLSFAIKACAIPSEEFKQHSLDVIEECTKRFYSLYQKLFGIHNCTYNTHIVGSHLPEIRYHGPLTFTSAFPFESFYSELRNSFVPGTQSTLKQVLQNVLMKRVLTEHRCENEIYISVKETAMECNNMIYTYERRQFAFYKVISIDDDMLTCYSQEKLPCSFPETPNLPWHLNGVFKTGNLIEEPILVQRQRVKGKVLAVNDFLISCPKNILHEK